MTTNAPTQAVDQLTGTYQLDAAHSRLGFVARYALVTRVRGSFDAFEGRLQLDGADPAKCSVALTIDAASIRTSNPDRDAHLRSADFFDVDRYPTIAFESTSVRAVRANRYRVTGDLAMKGTSKPVALELTYEGSCVDPYGQLRLAFVGTGSLKRSEWGLTWNAPLEAGGVVLGDRIDLELDASAIKTN